MTMGSVLFWLGIAVTVLGVIVLLSNLGKDANQRARETGFVLFGVGIGLAVVVAAVTSFHLPPN